MKAFLYFAVVLSQASAAPEGSGEDDAVAVVTSLEGQVTVIPPGGPSRGLEVFDWISRDSVVNADPEARTTLAFVDGSRWEVTGKAVARITESGPNTSSGKATRLSSVPPMPQLSLHSSEPGTRSAAVRVRGGSVRNLYPRPNARTLADETLLRFSPEPGAVSYKVQIENERGDTIHTTETRSSEVRIPKRILTPGERYYWRVTSVPAVGESKHSATTFVTLPEEVARLREALKSELGARNDAESFALLAAVDRRLGLLAEALEELEAALALSPGHEAIRSELEELRSQLEPR